MEGLTLFENIQLASLIIGAIVAIIQFVKAMLEKTDWQWVRKMPGEVWFGVSILMGVVAALLLNYNALQEAIGTSLPISDKLATVATGIGMGLSSKVVHAVATPIGAKLKEIKETAKVNSELLQTPVVCPPDISGSTVVSPSVMPITPAAPVEPEVILLKTTESNPDYVLIDEKVYKRQKGENK